MPPLYAYYAHMMPLNCGARHFHFSYLNLKLLKLCTKRGGREGGKVVGGRGVEGGISRQVVHGFINTYVEQPFFKKKHGFYKISNNF